LLRRRDEGDAGYRQGAATRIRRGGARNATAQTCSEAP
jgi:hypothetical protein